MMSYDLEILLEIWSMIYDYDLVVLVGASIMSYELLVVHDLWPSMSYELVWAMSY